MKIYVICPYNCSEEWKNGINKYINTIKKKNVTVTSSWNYDKKDITGYDTYLQKNKAIKKADKIHIAWDGKDKECLFELGMAFTYNKNISLITGYFPKIPPEHGKNIIKTLYCWEAISNNY